MAITFPNDKTGLNPPGVGPLVTGDLYRASNTVLYEYDADDTSWTGPTDGRPGSEPGVPIPLPRNQAFVLKDPIDGVEEFLVSENSTLDGSVDDGFYIVYDVAL